MSTPSTDPRRLADLFGDPICSYTRAQALSDGTLVALPADLTAEAGFAWPVLVTASVHANVVRWGPREESESPGTCQDQTGRTWDVLWMTRCATVSHGQAAPGQRVPVPLYRVPVTGGTEAELVTLEVVLAVEDDQPALVLMFPHED